MNDIWHYGKKVDNGFLVQKGSKNTQTVVNKIPTTEEEIVDINTALAFILGGENNLQRVSGYECANHNKIHKYTFLSCITFTVTTFIGKDTEEEVIELAKELCN